MNKIFKRLLSVVLAVVMVVTLVPLSGSSTVEAAGESKVIYLHATVGNAPYKAQVSGDAEGIKVLNTIKVSDDYYRVTVPSGKTTVMFVDRDGNWLANGNNWPTIPTDEKNCFEPASLGGNDWSWSTYSEGGGADTVETFMVNADLVDYFNNARVSSGSDGKSYSENNEGNGTDKNEPVYSAWNYVIAGNDSTGNSAPTYPLYFGGLGHKTNRKMQQVTNSTWGTHGLPNFSLTANVALSDFGHAAVQGAVDEQLVNGNLADPVTKEELPYFSKTPLYNGGKQVTAYYSNLQFPFKKTTSASGQTTYSYDSATDYAVYYDYGSHKLYKSNIYSYNTTADENGVNEKGYYPFDNEKNYNPGSGDSYDSDAANKRNMGFGTKFTIPFTLSMDENRQINGQDVIFSFTGDDDVWVFIDDVLVLDMGGAHYKASGEINFTNQTVTVDEAYNIQKSTNWTDGTFSDGNSSWDQPTSISAGVTVGKDVNSFSSITGTFTGETGTKTLADILADDTKVHTLTMFYMERGMYDSNMSISFTFNPVPSGLVLSKEVDTANVNSGLSETVKTKDYFDFKIEKAEHDSTTYSAASGIQYTKEYDGAGSESATTTQEGVVENLADNIYAYNFTKTDGNNNTTEAFTRGDKFKITETGFDTSKYTTRWYVWDQRENKRVDGQENSTTATFDLGTYTDDPYAPGVDYAVNFVNTPIVKDVTLTKEWQNGVAEDEDTFEFKVLVDLDGEGSAYTYAPYELEYTYVDSEKTGGTTNKDGKLALGSGETVKFAGIPVGAKVKVEETQENNAYWEAVNDTDEITVSEGDNKLKITNTTKAVTLDKVIYAEAGTIPTVYKPTDVTITNATLTSGQKDGAKVETDVSTKGQLNVKAPTANEAYVYKIEGTTSDGKTLDADSTLTVYTYKATDKVYVFDYGLESNIAATNENGDGLFEGGVFYNDKARNTEKYKTSAKLDEINDSGENTQTDITADPEGVSIKADGSSDGEVTFKPQAFMDQAENYTYSADVTKNGVTLDEKNPETGTVVNGTIKVMPANVVYYEDNFNSDADSTDSSVKIIYSGNNTTEGVSVKLTQSNGQTEQYGHDEAYATGTQDSGGSSTALTAEGYSTKAEFTFTGTGFDVVARTTNETAGIMYTIQKYADNAWSFVKTGVVDTYYANGDLYQIPVIHEELGEKAQYKVILLIKTTNSGSVVYLDGIRIYNPMGTEGAEGYIEGEKGASFEKVSDLILGDGQITETGVVDEYGSKIKGQTITGAKAVLLDSYFEGGAEENYMAALGYTSTENSSENSSSTTNSLLQYMHSGPNNEIYLNSNASLAFVAEGSKSDESTIQIEAKMVNIDDPTGTLHSNNGVDLNVWDGNDLVEIGKVSATAMYYTINTENCIKLQDGKYLVVISGNIDSESGTSCLAFSNLKYKGYTLSNPLSAENKTLIGDRIDTSALDGEEESMFVALENTEVLRKNQWSTYKWRVTLREDVFKDADPEFTMYYTNNNKKTKITVTTLKDDETENTYYLRFRAPNALGTFPIELHYVTDGKESTDYIASSMKVNR